MPRAFTLMTLSPSDAEASGAKWLVLTGLSNFARALACDRPGAPPCHALERPWADPLSTILQAQLRRLD